MPTIYLDSALNDEKRRHRLYGGRPLRLLGGRERDEAVPSWRAS